MCCSVAVLHGHDLIELAEAVGQRHSERVLPMIDAALVQAKLRLSQIDVVAFGPAPDRLPACASPVELRKASPTAKASASCRSATCALSLPTRLERPPTVACCWPLSMLV